MATSLVGTVVNSCDAVTGFSAGNISGDDDFVEGTGALGVKISSGTTELYTTSIAGGPYNFSSGGGQEGYHAIMWFNTKTPINATTGMTIIMGNGTDRGRWNVLGSSFYKGGFVTRVIDTAANFDTIAAGTWTVGGNPAQLSNITQVGGGFTTTTTIMGSFNNVQIDQITIGLGVRVDAGTALAPNTFETVRAADEDTAFWGWWSSAFGGIIGKGKLFIGPAAGTTASWFVDTAFKVTFADELVAVGFYDIEMRGENTTCTWNLANISAANSASARWSITLDTAMGDTTGGFTDTNGVFTGFDTITLNANASMTGTTLIDGSLLVQNSATLDALTILDANTITGAHAVLSNNPSNITNCEFTQGAAGHAVRCDTVGTYNWTGNFDTGYTGTRGTNLVSGTGSTDAMFYNNSGGLITLNVGGGGQSPSVRNGVGATQGLSSISFQAYSFPLSNGEDLKRTLLGLTDAFIQGANAPYDGMSIDYLEGVGFTTFAGSTVYPAKSVVKDDTGRWFFTAGGGTSTAAITATANDVSITDWTPYFGEEQIGTAWYAFNRIVNCNGGTDLQAYGFMQSSLKLATTINDLGTLFPITAGQGVSTAVIGQVASLLGAYVGDTLKPAGGVVLRGFDTNSTNSIVHSPINLDSPLGLDSEGVPTATTEVPFPFVAAGNFNFSSNLDTAVDAQTFYTVYFEYITRTTGSFTLTVSAGATGDLTWASTALDHIQAGDYVKLSGFITNPTNNGLYLVNSVGANTMNVTLQTGVTIITETNTITVDENPFESPGAVIVNDNTGPSPMSGMITGPSIVWDFDYTNNAQGGRTPDTNAPIRVVAQALDGAEWTDATFTITKATGQNIAINANDERNYANP